MESPSFPRYLDPPMSKYSPQHHVLKHPQLPFFPSMSATKFHTHTKQQANWVSSTNHLDSAHCTELTHVALSQISPSYTPSLSIRSEHWLQEHRPLPPYTWRFLFFSCLISGSHSFLEPDAVICKNILPPSSKQKGLPFISQYWQPLACYVGINVIQDTRM